jgi:hypothetical protein
MQALMIENERRLKEVMRLTEERVQGMLFKKADREKTEEAIRQMISKSELTETMRKYRHMYNVLEPLIDNEDTMGRLISKLEQMKMLSDEQLEMLENGANVNQEETDDGK